MDVIGAHIGDGDANNQDRTGLVQLWNPSDSGVNFFLKAVDLAWTATNSRRDAIRGFAGFDMVYVTVALSDNNPRQMYDKVNPASASPVQMRSLTTSTLPTGPLLMELWCGDIGRSVTRHFEDGGIRVMPGSGLVFRASNPYLWTIVTAEGTTETAA